MLCVDPLAEKNGHALYRTPPTLLGPTGRKTPAVEPIARLLYRLKKKEVVSGQPFENGSCLQQRTANLDILISDMARQGQPWWLVAIEIVGGGIVTLVATHVGNKPR